MQKVALRETTWEELALYYNNVEKAQQILLRHARDAWILIGSALCFLSPFQLHRLLPEKSGAYINIYIHTTEEMYKELCQTLEISLSIDTMKEMADAALRKAAGQANASWSLRGGIMVYLSGLIFLNVILKQAQKSANPHEFSDEDGLEMKQALAEIYLTREDSRKAREAIEN